MSGAAEPPFWAAPFPFRKRPFPFLCFVISVGTSLGQCDRSRVQLMPDKRDRTGRSCFPRGPYSYEDEGERNGPDRRARELENGLHEEGDASEADVRPV